MVNDQRNYTQNRTVSNTLVIETGAHACNNNSVSLSLIG
nr:MAG TPA: hypothetical protein [Caudoviricetes sp.]